MINRSGINNTHTDTHLHQSRADQLVCEYGGGWVHFDNITEFGVSHKFTSNKQAKQTGGDDGSEQSVAG